MLEWYCFPSLPDPEAEVLVCRQDGSKHFATLVPQHMLTRFHAAGPYGTVWMCRGCMIDDVTHWAYVNDPRGVRFPEFPVQVLLMTVHQLYPNLNAEVRYNAELGSQFGHVVKEGDTWVLLVGPHLPVPQLLDVIAELLSRVIDHPGMDAEQVYGRITRAYDDALACRQGDFLVATQVGACTVELGAIET